MNADALAQKPGQATAIPLRENRANLTSSHRQVRRWSRWPPFLNGEYRRQETLEQMQMTGKELADIRRAAGLSQTELARRIGVGRHAVSYWENKAAVDFRSWAVRKIAEVLPLPDKPTPVRARTGWGVTLSRAEMALIEAKLAADRARQSAKCAKRRVRCGAKTRDGHPCKALSLPGKRRCRFHGGMSTGPKTVEGRARIADAQRKRWAARNAV